ncbi:MAG: alpha/beta hydrolase [Candidatus Susulua stagnicola]|nr:alpha/beta hydrolase [Candidatus Susulua stagnicola]
MLGSNFKYLDRGKDKTIVLIPGWATDYRIFDLLNLEFNYLLLIDFSFSSFETSLFNALRNKGIKKVSLLGWSLGGFLAARFAQEYPELTEELILLGIRKKYNQEKTAEIGKLLKRSKKTYLYKFYQQCFFKPKSMSWFKENLLKAYCQDFDLEYLLKTLDYLVKSQINTQELSAIKKIKIIHGERDQIAPINEAREVCKGLVGAELITIKNCGHALFLETDLKKYI